MRSSKDANHALAAVCFIFFSLGLVTASLGPLLGEFAANTSATLAAVGVIFTTFFLGALVSQIINGFVSERIGLTPLLIGGAILVAFGFSGIAFSRSLFILLGAALIAGFGHGAINLGGNLTIAAIFHDRRVTAVNFINIFYGLGAFAGPALVGFVVPRLNSGTGVLLSGAGLIFIAAILMVRVSPRRAPLSTEASGPHGSKLAVYASPILWALALLSLFYGGSETGMSGWTTTYLQQSVSFTLEKAAFATSAFYMMLTLGRIICSWLGSKLSDVQVLAATLITTVIGTIILIAGYANPVLSVIGVMAIGLGYGGTYPTMVALTTIVFRESTGKAAGLVISMGSIGAMFLPSLQGVIIAGQGPRPAGFMIAAEAVLMLVMLLFVRSRLVRTKVIPQTVEN